MEAASGVLCYLCKEPGKKCTGCRLIAYCGVSCQRKDWKYHSNSCHKKPSNVMDSLINNQSYQPIVAQILLYLSGKQLHAFRQTKRSWRDAITVLWRSRSSRKILEQRLKDQWLDGNACEIRNVFEGDGFIDRIAADRGEMLMAYNSSCHIAVRDATNNYKPKYMIPKNKQSNVWAVHKDFVMMYTGSTFSCWDRHNQKEIQLGKFGKQIQVGEHCKNVKKWNNKVVKKCDDEPVCMKVFEDIGFIMYESNLIIKFRVESPYSNLDVADDSGTSEFTFKDVEIFDQLLAIDRVEPPSMWLHNYNTKVRDSDIIESNTSDTSLANHTEIYIVQKNDDESMVIWDLENKKEKYTIKGVHAVCDVHHDPSVLYVAICRVYYHTTEEELEEVFGDGERYMNEGWMNTPHLQIWSQRKCCRTLLVPGLKSVRMNSDILAVSRWSKGEISLWNTRHLVDKKNYPLTGLGPIKRIQMDNWSVYPTQMLLLHDRFLWCEVEGPLEDEDPSVRLKDIAVRVREISFWYC